MNRWQPVVRAAPDSTAVPVTFTCSASEKSFPIVAAA